MKKTATVKNDFGVAVKKCCMSCAHRDCTRLREMRFCNELHMEVGRYTVCGQWQMSDKILGLSRIDKGRGGAGQTTGSGLSTQIGRGYQK